MSAKSNLKAISMDLIGSITSGVVAAVVSAIVSYWTFNRQQFNDTITKERLNFIKDWRECATWFCVLLKMRKLKESPGFDEGCCQPLEYYYYKLLLMCNSTKAESYVDIEVVRMLEQLYDEKDSVDDEQIRRFVALMQANLSLEWKGTNLESRKGQLSEEEKENLRLDSFECYKKWENGK